MKPLRLPILLLAVLAAVVVGLTVALPAGASLGPCAGLPPGWTHAAVNVTVKRAPRLGQTVICDRGRVIAVGAASLTLKESDGTVWVIPVAPNALITLDGQQVALSQVLELDTAQTVSVNGGAATTVIARITPAALKLQAHAGAQAKGAGT